MSYRHVQTQVQIGNKLGASTVSGNNQPKTLLYMNDVRGSAISSDESDSLVIDKY